jgi:SRSO17 transposase
MGTVVTVRDIAGWDADLWKLTDGLGWLFNRPEPRETFGVFVRALLSDVPKKNSWGLAEYAGLATPRSFEHLLDGACWDVEELRDVVRAYVLDGLGDAQGALVLDDTQVIKKGDRSVGVGPQHCGSTNQTENCQCTVMLTYASKHGHAFIDRELYLPERWTDHPERCAAAGVPAERGFATKPQLGVRMLTRVLDEDEGLRFRWLAADSGYGRDPGLREFCHIRRVPYVLGVPVDLPLVGIHGQALRPDAILAQMGHQVGWERRSAGAGSKGQRYYDWAAHAVVVKGQPPAEGFAHTLLIRRSTRKKVTKQHPTGRYDIEFFLVHAPVGTPVSAMIRAAGLRWNIEDDNKAGKDLVGFDQYQVRNWTPWYRHITICMLAHAYLAVTAANLGKDLPRDSGATPGSAPS